MKISQRNILNTLKHWCLIRHDLTTQNLWQHCGISAEVTLSRSALWHQYCHIVRYFHLKPNINRYTVVYSYAKTIKEHQQPSKTRTLIFTKIHDNLSSAVYARCLSGLFKNYQGSFLSAKQHTHNITPNTKRHKCTFHCSCSINKADRRNIHKESRKYYNYNYSPDVNRFMRENNYLRDSLAPHTEITTNWIHKLTRQINTKIT